MKRAILYSVVSLILITVLLYRFGFFYVNISPHNYYRLTQNESILFGDFVLKFWGKVEKEEFDEIKNDLFEDEEKDRRYNEIINGLKENHDEFGKIISWEFFRSASPRITSEWAKNPDEKIYQIEYLTKAEKGGFCAWFTFYVELDGEIKLFGLSLDSPVDWRIEERDKQKLIVEKYPNEVIIPYADRYIEIRY